MHRTAAVVLLVAAVTLGVAGCSGGTKPAAAPSVTVASTPTATPSSPDYMALCVKGLEEDPASDPIPCGELPSADYVRAVEKARTGRVSACVGALEKHPGSQPGVCDSLSQKEYFGAVMSANKAAIAKARRQIASAAASASATAQP